MFYSQTFLNRKGPLSTVWIAAHLQHRLKKSHYTSTDIPSTVQHIMDPGVPIALRMSGHLLLGVVRIYSKKVDYLFYDCNVVLTGLSKAFASMQLTLEKNAVQAPFQSITLPSTFDLDAVNFDDEPYHTGIEDIHTRSQEDITLTDQIPVATDPYIAISFDEDMMEGSSHTEVLPDSGVGPIQGSSHTEVLPDSGVGPIQGSSHTEVLPDSVVGPIQGSSLTEVLPDSGAAPMDEDVIPQSPLANVGFQGGASASIQRESPITEFSAGDHSHNVQDNTPPEAEILRDGNKNHNLENPLVDPIPKDKDSEPTIDHGDTMNEKNIPEEAEPEPIIVSPQRHIRPSTPVTSQGHSTDSHQGRSFSIPVLRESPPPIEQPQRRGRKRKQFFDEPIVLTNKLMRRALNNPRDILRKRREMPSSTLETWKLNNSRRVDQIFDQPLLTGLCKDILDISKREHILSKRHLVISEEDHEDAGIAKTPSPTNQIPEEPRPVTPPATSPAHNVEIEVPRNVAASSPPTSPAHNVEIEVPRNGAASPPPTSPALNVEIEVPRNGAASPPPTIPVHSEDIGFNTGVTRDDDFTSDFGFTSVSPQRTNVTNRTIQTPDSTTSPTGLGSILETPTTYQDTFQNLGLSNTLQDLSFLDVDNNSPTSSQYTIEGINLSERTRSVAEYLRRPITPIMEDPSEDLSLNKILEGKTRKISARMFFEVLVLKSHGLIDVEQEEPYGDVSLKLTPALKRQI